MSGENDTVLIVGGDVVTAEGVGRADVLVRGEAVAEVFEPSARPPGDHVYDATGRLVFPGFIDPHVHSREPGMTEKEDFWHATRSSAAGGVTTILEMPNCVPAVVDGDALRARADRLTRDAWVDFGMWGLATGRNADAIGDMARQGAVAVKAFLCFGYEDGRLHPGWIDGGPDLPSSRDLLEAMSAAADAGIPLGVHAEDGGVISFFEARLERPAMTYPELLATRPVVAESAAVALCIELASAVSARLHVLHLSSAVGVELIRAAHSRGIDVTAETCPHYLLLDGADFDRLGAVMKVLPPIRDRGDQEALWAAVDDGVVASVGSDHAPHTEQEKHDRLNRVPGGVVAAQTLVPLMLDAALAGRLPLDTLVSRLCTSTASMFGLYPKKGALAPGSDADLVIVDPHAGSRIDPASFESKQRWSPFAGRVVRGRVEATMLRGRWLLRDGTILGPPRGRWVRRRAQASGTKS